MKLRLHAVHKVLASNRRLAIVAVGAGALALQLGPGCGRGLVDGNGHVAASAPVSPDGGAVRLGQAAIQAPAGAVATTTEITVERQPASDNAPLTDVYQFGPEGLMFAKPVTMQLPSPADTQAGIALWVDPDWEAVAGSHYDAQMGVVVGDVMHFSRYACLRLCSANSGCSSDKECRRGVCQRPLPSGSGGSGSGGTLGSGGSGSGGSGTGGGGTGGSGTGGRGTGGVGSGGRGTGGSGAGGSGTGGSGTGGGSGGNGTGGAGSGGNGTGGSGTGGSGTGGNGAGGSGTGGNGTGGNTNPDTCPPTQPPIMDTTCPNPPQTCNYGATQCICMAGRVWSCGPVGAGGAAGGGGGNGGGGTSGSGGAAGGNSGTGGLGAFGAPCNVPSECLGGRCVMSDGVTACATYAGGCTCGAVP